MRFIAIIIFSLLCEAVFSQKVENSELKNQFGLVVGIAVPHRNFSDGGRQAWQASNRAAHAVEGLMYELNFEHSINEEWALTGIFRNQFHSVDNPDLGKDYAETFNALSHTIKIVQNWNISSFMIGGVHKSSLSQNKKLSIKSRIGLGMATAHSAHTRTITEFSDSTMVRDVPSKTASAFCYMIGIVCSYQLTEHFGILLSIDGFASYPKFEKNFEKEYYKTRQNIVTSNYALGASYSF